MLFLVIQRDFPSFGPAKPVVLYRNVPIDIRCFFQAFENLLRTSLRALSAPDVQALPHR